MEKQITQIYQVLQRLMGLHRQLLDTVRLEREALTQADLKGIQEAAVAKQALVEAIRQADSERTGFIGDLALAWKTPVRDLTLSNLVIAIQGDDPKGAEQLRSCYNALTILIQRITEQNQDNAEMIQKSLVHIQEMKRNVLGESVPKANTYTQKGQRADGQQGGARLISKEA